MFVLSVTSVQLDLFPLLHAHKEQQALPHIFSLQTNALSALPGFIAMKLAWWQRTSLALLDTTARVGRHSPICSAQPEASVPWDPHFLFIVLLGHFKIMLVKAPAKHVQKAIIVGETHHSLLLAQSVFTALGQWNFQHSILAQWGPLTTSQS